MPDFVKYTNISSLFPYLYKYQLITQDDYADVDKQTPSEGIMYYYTRVLPSKGPKAHLIFYQCLREAAEETNCHLGHRELLKFF